MIRMYILLARMKHSGLVIPEMTDEFIFCEQQDALNAMNGMTNIPHNVVELELHEFISNKLIAGRSVFETGSNI